MVLSVVYSGATVNIRRYSRRSSQFVIKNFSNCCGYKTATMKASLTAIFLFTIGIVLADDDVASEFVAAILTPYVAYEAPTKLIEVKYGVRNVTLGNKFGAPEVSTIPKIDYESESGVFYTLVMIDPDVPPLGPIRQVLHWLVGNIPENRVSEGVVLANYLMPIPIPYTGQHRYTFLLYEQKQGRIEFDQRDFFLGFLPLRPLFSTNEFIRRYYLGPPFAGNFFRLNEVVPRT